MEQISEDNDRNISGHCPTCKELIYKHPFVRKKDDPNKIEFMDTRFEVGKEPQIHICYQQKEKRYDYEAENRMPPPPSILVKTKERTKEELDILKKELDEKSSKYSIKKQDKKELKDFITKVEDDIESIKKQVYDTNLLIHALIKIMDEVYQKNNKDGESLLFHSAKAELERRKKTATT